MNQIEKFIQIINFNYWSFIRAAFTTLSGIEFQLLGYDPLVVTYGGPKVGNQEFADFTDRLFDTEEVANCITMKNDFSRGFIRWFINMI